jgi:predicted transposase YdaD
VLNGRLVKKLQETIMDDKRYAESRWVREMRHEMFGDHEAEFLARGKAEGKAEGEAKGKRDALLLVLEGRGLSMTKAQRAAILTCEDLAKLDRWVAASGRVASVQELLAEAPKKNGARNGSAKHRTARAS